MVFVADVIPHELRRVVEFLNQQMNPAEVLALEVKQYVGQNLQTLVPRIIGQTAAAQQRRGTSKQTRPWDEAAFFEAIQVGRSEAETEAAKRLYQWALERRLRIWWGRGQQVGSFFPMLDLHRRKYYSFAVTTDGRVHLQLHRMTNRPALPDHNYAHGMLAELRGIPGVEIPDDRLEGVPWFELRLLTARPHLDRFLAVFDAYVSHVRAHPPDDDA